MRLLRFAAFVAAIGLAAPASAEPLSLAFANGRVTLRAENIPLRQILQEWARIGQTRVVGLERLSGAPVTLELTDVPEKQALEVLLRSIAGYVAAPRFAGPVNPATSTFDRLLLLPTSVAAPPPPARASRATFAPPPPPQQQMPPDPIQLANGESEGPEMQTPGNVPIFEPSPVSGPAGPLPPGQRPGEPTIMPPPDMPQPQPQGPLTSPRPGILPVPQPQPPQPRP